jgi:acylphosphatase
LGLCGHVRNTPSGEVEVEAEGNTEVVEQLVALLRRGPSAARVTGVQVAGMVPADEDDGFHVRF